MPTRPTRSHHKVPVRIDYQFLNTTSFGQHGSLLLDLPKESLTHVTSYLTLPSLLTLAHTCKRLWEHVDDDNTWLRAFFTQFLGISPEHELDKQRILLLRRTENTWRKEFIHRYSINQRWSHSYRSTVSYIPNDSAINDAHLMSEYAILTSSLQYGVVARSIPLTGKVLKGYIDASASGLGIGNPNVEFTPNVSACAMTSDGSTARVFWGKHTGEVVLTYVRRVMDSRAEAKLIRCAVNDQHEGAVQYLVPDSGSNTFMSAGADGRIKLWDTKTLRLLWSTDKQQLSLVTDPFISIVGCLGDGFIAGALKSGDILVYHLQESGTLAGGRRVNSTNQLRISSPIHHKKSDLTVWEGGPSPEQQVTKLWLHGTGESTLLLLVQYTHHPLFYRIHVDIQSHNVAITPYGDSCFANISVVEPVISTSLRDNNMVIVGDKLGFVSIYDAGAPPQDSFAPIHRFEGHPDAVTAISYTPTVFATGTAIGATTIWDSLTLEPMRCFATPARRRDPGHEWDPVSRVLLSDEFAVIVVGKHVMTCKLGTANDRERLHKKPRHANTKLNITTKRHEQYEMQKDITESYMELEYEREYAQRIYGREREQRSTLDRLGLSELEAVEYLLMLSREEEEARHQRMTIDEGVFEGDFDDLPGTPTSSPSRTTPSTPVSPLYTSPSYHANGRQYLRVSLPISNEKVQVTPPFVREPMEAGTSASPVRPLALPSPMTAHSTSSSSLEQFPSLSLSLSSSSSSKQGTSGSPRSAWNTQLKSLSPSPVIARHKEAARVEISDTEGMDDDLRLAIELSLAEARGKVCV